MEMLRGKDTLVQAVVKNIARREDKPPETRSDEELRELLRARGAASVQSRVDQMVDEGVKKALLETCDVDADKVNAERAPFPLCWGKAPPPGQ